jgi:hypothetical protein
MGAVLAACHMAAEGCRAAALDGAHHLELVEGHVAAVGVTPRGPVAAEGVRDLQSWAGHAGPLRRWRSDCSLWYERREPVQEIDEDRIALPVPTDAAIRASERSCAVIALGKKSVPGPADCRERGRGVCRRAAFGHWHGGGRWQADAHFAAGRQLFPQIC